MCAVFPFWTGSKTPFFFFPGSPPYFSLGQPMFLFLFLEIYSAVSYLSRGCSVCVLCVCAPWCVWWARKKEKKRKTTLMGSWWWIQEEANRLSLHFLIFSGCHFGRRSIPQLLAHKLKPPWAPDTSIIQTRHLLGSRQQLHTYINKYEKQKKKTRRRKDNLEIRVGVTGVVVQPIAPHSSEHAGLLVI